jgi:hypothetical protein
MSLYVGTSSEGSGRSGIRTAIRRSVRGGPAGVRIFSITGRIWVLVVAHAAFDVTAVAIIYWNLESTVAHLVFK